MIIYLFTIFKSKQSGLLNDSVVYSGKRGDIMKDFPFFTTENGVASITLKEIPYTKTAYIKIQDSLEPEKLIEECVGFCKMAGAEKILGSGHLFLEQYPLYTQIVQMARLRDGLPDTDAALFPVMEQTLCRFREIYNDRMSAVPNSSFMSISESKELLQRGNGYFIHRGEMLLGIGIASGEKIDAVISICPGAGEDVVLALNHALSGDQAVLEVASTNYRAIRLYERIGFVKTVEISRWYRLL